MPTILKGAELHDLKEHLFFFLVFLIEVEVVEDEDVEVIDARLLDETCGDIGGVSVLCAINITCMDSFSGFMSNDDNGSLCGCSFCPLNINLKSLGSGDGDATLTLFLKSSTVELSGMVTWNDDSVDNLIVTFICDKKEVAVLVVEYSYLNRNKGYIY